MKGEKYSKAELQRMARRVLRAVDKGDPKGMLCIMGTAARTGLRHADVMIQIKKLATGE